MTRDVFLILCRSSLNVALAAMLLVALPTYSVGAQCLDTMVYRPETFSEYLNRSAGPRAILRSVALSGFDQAIKRPKEWDRTWHGYEDRLSSRLASNAIAQTVVFNLSRTAGERRSDFTLCHRARPWVRFRHAVLTPLRVNTPHGIELSPLTPLAEVGSALLVTFVQPRGFSAKEGLRAGLTALAASAGVSVAREFWPWRRRPPRF